MPIQSTSSQLHHPTLLPLVIYDYRVLCFLIYGTIETNTMLTPHELVLNRLASPKVLGLTSLANLSDSELTNLANQLTDIQADQLANHELTKYINCCWAVVANRGPNAVPYEPHTAVIVDDNGGTIPYWRKQLYPQYKGNRKQKPDLVLSVGQLGLQYINQPNSPYSYFSVPGYEADDLAGAFVYIKRLNQQLPDGDPLVAERPLWLYTVDSDWLQLVGNQVTWFNSGPWEPRVRGHLEAIEWAQKRLKVNLRHPSQIVDTKMKQGDKSDNLPRNTPRYMIDLMTGHPKYHLRHNSQVWSQLKATYKLTAANQNLDHLEAAKKWIWSRGYRIPV
jgi:hypothetical protein